MLALRPSTCCCCLLRARVLLFSCSLCICFDFRCVWLLIVFQSWRLQSFVSYLKPMLAKQPAGTQHTCNTNTHAHTHAHTHRKQATSLVVQGKQTKKQRSQKQRMMQGGNEVVNKLNKEDRGSSVSSLQLKLSSAPQTAAAPGSGRRRMAAPRASQTCTAPQGTAHQSEYLSTPERECVGGGVGG